ncbi:MAG: hypothetical protein WD709_05200, partial [Gammaproteobacteria bacterium]
MADSQDKHNTVLTAKIDELESLLTPGPDQEVPDTKLTIPILDELVDTQDYEDALAVFDEPADNET